jgi:CrcB protein
LPVKSSPPLKRAAGDGASAVKSAAGHGWRAWAAVAAGGLLGTELRYGLGLLFPEAAGSVPWTTLGINVAGSFVLGALTTIWIARPHTAFWLRAGIGPGVLGSFTTFSALALSVDRLAGEGLHGVWLAYLCLSVILGLGAAAAGWRVGKVLGGLGWGRT